MIGLPAMAGNDANVAALGEAWKGAASGASNVVMVTLGTGVGGGIIVNGKIVSGTHGAGGEVGHAHINDDETEKCNCGNKGCLEQVASATGIVRIAKKCWRNMRESILKNARKLSAKMVLDAFKERAMRLLCRLWNMCAKELGSALSVFAAVVDPETIVVGGGVSKAGQPLIDCIRKYYQEYAFAACKTTPIVLARLGNDAGIYGAAHGDPGELIP